MIYLPKKHERLFQGIAKGEVQAFLIPLNKEKVENAAQKGFESIRCARRSRLLKPDLLGAAAFREGADALSSDCVWVQDVCKMGYEQLSCTVEQLSEIYDDLFPTLDLKDCLKRMTYDREYKESSAAPAVVNPLGVYVIETGMCPVRETSREWMRDEGVRVIHHELEHDEDEPLYFKGRVDEVGNEFYVYVSDKFDSPDCSAPTPELAYEKFVRAVYGNKVWEENRTVFHLKVIPCLIDGFAGIADFKQFGRSNTYRILRLSTVMDEDELASFVLAQTGKDADERIRRCENCSLNRSRFNDCCDFRAGRDSSFWNDPFSCPHFKF